MLPWKTILTIEKSSEAPVYLQIAKKLIGEIRSGVVQRGTKIPGTRTMAQLLNLNRQTVVRAYEELYSQGWLTLETGKGTFVSEHLPVLTPSRFTASNESGRFAERTGYEFNINNHIHPPASPNRNIMGFHDGPDVRLTPVEAISKAYRRVLQRKSGRHLLSYVEVWGEFNIRFAISEYLNSSRGLKTTYENILLTRGTQMALYLAVDTVISKGDNVIIADKSFRYADLVFIIAGANIIRVKVDDDGICVDDIEDICRKRKIRAVYVTTHHHFPTTVTLSAPRRMNLLRLASKYGFVILEDDYDYEFHYESSPILPLASHDHDGMTIYMGSFSKTLSPALRVGYIAAPANLIYELGKIRQIIDAQGDPILEQVIAEMLEDGEIKRHMKKSLRIYRERRDFLCECLRELSDYINFRTPEGGLSVWAEFDKRISVPDLSDRLKEKGIILSKGLLHDIGAGRKLNSTRMGFGWMNLKETDKAMDLLTKEVRKMDRIR